MSVANPTPAPWRADVLLYPDGREEWGIYASLVDERRRMVATCHGPDAESNAALLAAAHDLRSALVLLVKVFERVGGPLAVEPAIYEARRTLARAEQLP